MAEFVVATYTVTPALCGGPMEMYQGSTVTNKCGQSFVPSVTCDLDSAVFGLSKLGTPPTGTIVARLYNATGLYGTTSKPTGSAIAVSSTTITPSTLSTTNALYTFDFTGANRVRLTPGNVYIISVELDSASGGSSGVDSVLVDVGCSATDPGNFSYSYPSVGWTTLPAVQAWDMTFTVYGVGPSTATIAWIKA